MGREVWVGWLCSRGGPTFPVPFGVPSGRVCIILNGYNGAHDEKTKWRRRKFPSGISPE